VGDARSNPRGGDAVSWVRLDVETPADGRLAGTGHAWAWPAVVARAKRGNGRIPARDLTPRLMAWLWGPSEDAWTAALAHFVDAGLLVLDGDAYVLPGWASYQADPGAAGRQRSARHGVSRGVTVTSRDTGDVTPGHEASRAVTPDRTGQDRTGQDRTGQVAADAAPPRAQGRAREAAAAAATTPVPEGLSGCLEAWRLALRSARGSAPMMVGALDADAIHRHVADRGAPHVLACIQRAAEVAGGSGPSLALLGRIVAEGIHNHARPVRAPSGGRSAPGRGKSVNAAWASVQESSEESERW
jgi:hypothetical protein